MRTAACSLLLVLAGPVLAQQVADCDAAPPATELVEPWEETSVAFGAGAIRLALLHGAEEEGVRLLVLTLPPAGERPADEEAGVEEGEEAEPVPPAEPLAPPPRRCRIVSEGGLGFAALDMGAVEAGEDPEAATLTARIPALRFVPESTELEELTLLLTFGVGDDSLVAEIEETAEAAPGPEDGTGGDDGPAPEEAAP